MKREREMSSTININDDAVCLSRSSGANEPSHYMLKVESFSLLSEAGFHKYESDFFESSGYKWKLILYPNGNPEDGGENHISLYLAIVDTTHFPKGWEVNVYFKFFVYDYILDNYLTFQAADGKKMRFHSYQLELGFAKLLPLDTFKEAFLCQDTCVFGVEVFVTPKFVLKENCLSIIKPPTTNNSYTWTIYKFPALDENAISSEVFKVGNIKWKLVLCPKGELKGKGTHLSLYLSVIETESLPLHWKIYAKYKLRVLDQVGTDHVESEEVVSWFCESANCFGKQTLISLSDLSDKAKSYIVNDKLVVQVEIFAVGAIRSFVL